MKNIFGIFLALFVVSGAYAKTVTVGKVVDGDTFITDVSGGEIPVSIINVDTPELNGKCESEIELANKAKARLIELLPVETVVELKNYEEMGNRHKRIKAEVILPDGSNVGEILIKEKLGRPFDFKHHGQRWCK